MSWLVAGVACETGIAPQYLMEDGEMLRTMMAYMRWKAQQKGR